MDSEDGVSSGIFGLLPLLDCVEVELTCVEVELMCVGVELMCSWCDATMLHPEATPRTLKPQNPYTRNPEAPDSPDTFTRHRKLGPIGNLDPQTPQAPNNSLQQPCKIHLHLL